MFDAFANFNTMPTAPQVDFTYAHPGQTRFRRSLIRAVEALTGQPKLPRFGNCASRLTLPPVRTICNRSPRPGACFWWRTTPSEWWTV